MNKQDIRPPVRNNWFRGKLLDAHHLELETGYGTHKRWLLNRLVLGSGVVIGLDVVEAGRLAVCVTPGAAIDWRGREVVVPAKTDPAPIPEDVLRKAKHALHPGGTAPPKPQQQKGGKLPTEEVVVQVQVAYRQTPGDPVPPEYDTGCGAEACTPGSVYEGYAIRFHPDKAHRIACGCPAPYKKRWGDVDYRDLVHWVTRHRPAMELEPRPGSSAIALANVTVDVTGDDPAGWAICPKAIEIEVRPIVFYNDMLYELLAILSDRLGQY